MKIEIREFGEILLSRPAGREDYLKAKAYLLKQIQAGEEIEIDFKGVNVLAPSWADEFITHLKEEYKGNKIRYTHYENPSVKQTLEILK